MGISQESLARILSQYFVRQSRLLARNAWKVETNIWWVIVTLPPLLSSPGVLLMQNVSVESMQKCRQGFTVVVKNSQEK